MKTKSEFDGLRAFLYEKALAEQPFARTQDIEAMYRLLDPQKGESILGFGEGNGYFAREICEAVGLEGYYLVTDPSIDQLTNLERRVDFSQIEVKVMSIEGLEVKQGDFDKVWSFGAFHHVPKQEEAMNRIYKSLRPGGKLVLCDVFQGSNLAKHFDSIVARYCVTGHEVKFLSDDFAKTICHNAGFNDSNVRIEQLDLQWVFDSKIGLGQFIYDLHAMTKMTKSKEENINEIYNSCRDILGIENKNEKLYLNWPMKSLVAKKS
jgi:arsenite methyltransferase